jgi:hypothetical protein
MKSLCSGEEINPCLERMDFCKHLSLSLSPEKINVFFLNKLTCVLMLVHLQIKLLSSQRRAFLDLRDASPIAMEQLQRILGSPAI